MKKHLWLLLLITAISIAACEPADESTSPVTKDAESTTINTTNTTNNMNKEQQTTSPKPGDTIAVIKTSMGEIKAKIFTNGVPKTSQNFIELAKAGKYKNVPFHRVIEDFMIQGGDFENQNGTGGYSYLGPDTTLEDEFIMDYQHIKGALSMAKTAAPNSAGSQFFIVSKSDGTAWLDGAHAVFGQVYEGMDVVEAIEKVETDYADRPLTPVVMEDIEIQTL